MTEEHRERVKRAANGDKDALGALLEAFGPQVESMLVIGVTWRGSLDAGDMGNPGYGNPLHQAWFKRTVAHNTVLVDGQDHAADSPRVVEAEDRGAFAVVRVRAPRAIPGGTIRRTVVVGDGWLLDRVVVALEK
ncbi:MAG: heparinase II/III family protein, partial [Planctomycetes bacterium]|nr:heparinase II/III family protein [Planctomycetota bacterium]